MIHEVNREGLRPSRTHSDAYSRRPDGLHTHPAHFFIAIQYTHITRDAASTKRAQGQAQHARSVRVPQSAPSARMHARTSARSARRGAKPRAPLGHDLAPHPPAAPCDSEPLRLAHRPPLAAASSLTLSFVPWQNPGQESAVSQDRWRSLPGGLLCGAPPQLSRSSRHEMNEMARLFRGRGGQAVEGRLAARSLAERPQLGDEKT